MASGLQTFDCFITNIDKIGPLLKITGQINRQKSCFVENVLLNLKDKFENDSKVVHPSELTVGMLCCAKYRDDVYYRAHIRNIQSVMPGTVEVRFIDYGNVEYIRYENIRLIDQFSASLINIEPQATEFILAGVMHKYNDWTPQFLEQVLQEIAYVELKLVLVAIVNNFKFVKVIHQNADFSETLLKKGLIRLCPFDEQEMVLKSILSVPLVKLPPQAASVSPPKPQHSQSQELCYYKSTILPADSEHLVYVSYVEDGPNLFSVQLQSMEDSLEQLMNEITKIPLRPLTEAPIPGCACLARCLEDGSICRAVVTNIVGEECKTYFVDFGNTDNLPFSHIFQIPFKYILPKVMSMRFTLAGIKNLKLSNEKQFAFKDFVTNKLLKLKVLKPEGSPVQQLCELYENDQNILNIFYEKERSYKTIPVDKGKDYNVIVSYIEGCKKFFVQLKECSNSLNSLMVALANANNFVNNLKINDIKVGMLCSAYYIVDQQWYRAQIVSVNENIVTVKYVDYGNEDSVGLEFLKYLNNEFVDMLPAQAIECCLYGYQNMKFNSEIENVFESLTLECEFSMMVINKQSNEVLLVDLFDATGNNVAALLIEKLATQKALIPSLPSQHIANELLRSQSPSNENFLSPNSEGKLTWRNPNEKHTPEKKSWRENKDETKPWRDNKSNNDKSENKEFYKKSFGNSNRKSFQDSSPTDKQFDNPSQEYSFGDGDNQYNKRSFGNSNRKPFKETSLQSKSFGDGDNHFSKKTFGNSSRKPFSEAATQNSFDGESSKPFGNSNRKPFEDSPAENSFGDNSNKFKKPYERKQYDSNRKPFENSYSNTKSFESSPPPFSDNSQSNQKPFDDRRKQFGDRPPRKQFGDSGFRSDRNQDYNKRPPRDKNQFGEKKSFHDSSSRKSYDSDSSTTSDGRYKNKFDRNDKKFPPRENKNFDRSNRPSYQGNEKSFNNRFDKSLGTKSNFKPKTQFDSPEHKKLPPQDLAPFTQPFSYLEIAPGAAENVAISWFYNPEDFYIQLLNNQTNFKDMMCEIQSAYDGRPAFTGVIEVGSSIIAEFSEDNILYRATVLEALVNKYRVQYVDFGNTAVVSSDKIWQVETKFMNSPMQTARCGIMNIKPKGDAWPNNETIDNIFNKDSFVCIFETYENDRYGIKLTHNNFDVKQQLVDSGIAIESFGESSTADEQIDLTLLFGQNLLVRITNIESLDKFHIHLDKTKADDVLNKIEEFMSACAITTLQALTIEQLYDGLSCLIKSEEDKWHRGVILKINESDIEVAYADIGKTETMSVEKIFMLPAELCTYWYLAYECSLHNFSETVTVLEPDFKNKYINQDLLMYVDDVIDNRLIVTLYDLDGKKVELIEPDEGAYPTIEPICPVPIFSADQLVWVTHVENSNSVYLQLSSHTQIISDLLSSMFDFYDQNGEALEPTVDGFCAAKSENDGSWYRARIKNLTDTEINVCYIDYGNCELVPKENIKSLNKKFYVPHELSFVARLGLKELKVEAFQKLTELTSEKELKAHITFDDIGCMVCLYDGETNINQTLIDLQLATYEDVSATNIEPIMEENIEEVQAETRAQIIITHVDSPGEFYVQIIDNSEAVMNLQATLQEQINTFADLEGADIGVLCAAKYSIDEEWYRAEVLDADADITTVRFIDYGNTDVINNDSCKIKTLPADLLAIDKYARKCSLNVAPIKGDEWSQEAQEMFDNTINQGDAYADIVYQDERNKTYVELFVNGQNVAELLINANLATQITRDVEDKIANNTGFVSHLNSISEFWIQLESSVYDLEMICDRLANSDEFPDLQDLSPGILCAANYPDDEMWYRARILSNTAVGIEVLFVDYGNSSTAMKLKVLPEDLVQMPMLAQKCSLSKPVHLDKWSDRATEKFRELSADGVTVFTVKKLTAGETSIVELFIDGVNIVDQLTEQTSTTTKQDSVMAYVVFAKSPSDFYIQLESDNDNLNNMLGSLENAADFEAIENCETGLVCAAFSEEESMWYRARVISTENDNYQVLLLDYGNVIHVKKLCKLPEDISVMHPLATQCCLELPGEENEWSTVACYKFNKICENLETVFKVEFLDNESVKKVRLYVDDKSIADEIFDKESVKDKVEEKVTEDFINVDETLIPDSNVDTNEDISNDSLTVEKENEVYDRTMNDIDVNLVAQDDTSQISSALYEVQTAVVLTDSSQVISDINLEKDVILQTTETNAEVVCSETEEIVPTDISQVIDATSLTPDDKFVNAATEMVSTSTSEIFSDSEHEITDTDAEIISIDTEVVGGLKNEIIDTSIEIIPTETIRESKHEISNASAEIVSALEVIDELKNEITTEVISDTSKTTVTDLANKDNSVISHSIALTANEASEMVLTGTTVVTNATDLIEGISEISQPPQVTDEITNSNTEVVLIHNLKVDDDISQNSEVPNEVANSNAGLINLTDIAVTMLSTDTKLAENPPNIPEDRKVLMTDNESSCNTHNLGSDDLTQSILSSDIEVQDHENSMVGAKLNSDESITPGISILSSTEVVSSNEFTDSANIKSQNIVESICDKQNLKLDLISAVETKMNTELKCEVNETCSRPSTPKTPVDEKIVPGSINRGINIDD